MQFVNYYYHIPMFGFFQNYYPIISNIFFIFSLLIIVLITSLQFEICFFNIILKKIQILNSFGLFTLMHDSTL